MDLIAMVADILRHALTYIPEENEAVPMQEFLFAEQLV